MSNEKLKTNVVSLFPKGGRKAQAQTLADIQIPTADVLELLMQSVLYPDDPGAKSRALACFYALESQLEGFNLDVSPELLALVKDREPSIIENLEREEGL